MKLGKYFSLFFVFLPVLLFSKDYRFKHLKFEDGITLNHTYSIIQDREGFIWFGTLYGLVRYDGNEYKVFKHDPYDTNSVSIDDILCLYEDSKGYIWVGTWSGGLNRYDPNTKKFKRYVHNPLDSYSLSHPTVYAISEDAAGNLWIGTENGLNRLIPANDPENSEKRDIFVHYFADSEDRYALNNNKVRDLFMDSGGRLWIGVHEGGLHYYDIKKDRFIRFEEVTRDGSTSIVDVFEDSESNLWLATWGGGLKKVQLITTRPDSIIGLRTTRYMHDEEDPKSLSNDYVWTVTEDKSGQIWVGTDNGLNLLTANSNQFEYFKHNPKVSQSPSSSKISALFVDHTGIIWVGTFRGGIDMIIPDLSQFEHYLHNPFDPMSLIDKEVTAIYQDKDENVWVGTAGGLTRIKRSESSDSYKNYTFRLRTYDTEQSNHVTSLTMDNNNILWIGTQNGLIALHKDGTKERFNLPIYPGENEQGNIVTTLLYDSKGWLWVGTITHGLNIFNPKTKIFSSFRHNPDNPESISSNYVTSLYEDQSGNIWVGTYSGLNKLQINSPSSEQPDVSFQRFINIKDERTFINQNIFAICEDRNQNLYIGTNNGLFVYKKTLNELLILKESDGLPNNFICGLLNDNLGNVWASTRNGLVKINLTKNIFQSYYELHGLQENQFSLGAYFKAEDGKLLFGGINGFNAFYPENVSHNEHVPPVVLTSFKVFDEERTFEKRLNALDEITLNHDENFFTFTFASLDYRLPERNQYDYFLEGFDRNWVDNETKNYASYTNLDPGKYIFRVRGSNSDGVWNREGKSIALVITPPYWATWWFKSLIALIVLAILIFITYQIQQSEKKKTEINKKIADLKLQALRAQMNPHFIFNTINSIQYFISCNDKKSAFMYLSKFSKLMRKTLDNSARSRLILKEEMETLELYLELQRLRFENKFDYRIEIDPSIDVHSVEIPPMLLQPYIENAINHGFKNNKSKGEINILIKPDSDSLKCIIEDNGIGINRSIKIKERLNSKHKSTGMRLTRERLDIINNDNKGDVSVSILDLAENGFDQKGTRVTINIPLGLT